MEDRVRPEVRVTDPGAPPSPVPASPPPTPARARRGRLVPLLALLAAAAAGYGLSELHHAQQQSRARAVVPAPPALSLRAEQTGGVALATVADGAVQVRVPVLVRNTGAAAADLRGATLDGLGARGSSEGQRLLDPGQSARLVVSQDVRCPRTRRALQDAPEPGALAVSAASPGAPPQLVRLPLPGSVLDDVHDVLCSACEFVPLAGALELAVDSTRLTRRDVRLQLRVQNSSDRPVDVTAVAAPAGFRLNLLDRTGQRVRLPLRIAAGQLGRPAAPGPAELLPGPRRTGSRYEVRLSVRPGGCAQARRSTRDGVTPVPVSVLRDGQTSVLSQVDDAGLLQQLSAAACR